MYSTIAGTKRKLTESLYDDTEIDNSIIATDQDVVSWIDAAVGRSFTEDDLIGDDSVIRLAADCYNACRLMSEQLEGFGIDQVSLAKYRCEEARAYVTMWCNANGVVPTFDSESYAPVGVDFAVEVGSDSETIG